METTTPQKDLTLRAMTNDGAFRVMTVRSTETVAAAIRAQGATGANAVLFGQLLTASVLVRETMAPGLKVQCILASRAAGQLVADSLPDGTTRGLVQLAEGVADFPVEADDGALLVTRALPNGETHRGIVAPDPKTRLSAWLTQYMLRSEQITSRIAVGCFMMGGHVVYAGGYILQELPEADRDAVQAQTSYLDALDHIDPLLIENEADPQKLLDLVLKGHEYTLLATDEIKFGCNCSEERVLGALATIGRADIESIVSDGEVIDIDCDYCGTHYSFPPERLKTLLTPS
jgi:molecular chaperone Hsp33